MIKLSSFSAVDSRLSKISMLLLAMYPLLDWYEIPFTFSLGRTLILFFSAYIIAYCRFNINVLPASFLIVLLYVGGAWCTQHNYELWSLFPPGGWLFFLFYISLISGTITLDTRSLQKFMKYIVWLSIVLFWIQYVRVQTTGVNICFVPNLTGQFTYEDVLYDELVSRHINSLYPCSIFLEKSYMAYYLATYLTIVLFGPLSKDRWWDKEVIIICITLVFLRSGSGIVIMSTIMLIKIFNSFWQNNITRSVILITFSLPILIGAFWTYSSLESGSEILNRQSELSTEGTSGYARVVAGYVMFELQEPSEKMWGTNKHDLADEYGYNKEGNNVLYINGVQTILLTLGYVGMAIYLLFYTLLFRRSTIFGRMSIVVLFIMSLLESNYLNPYMSLFTIIPCGSLYHNRFVPQNKFRHVEKIS